MSIHTKNPTVFDPDRTEYIGNIKGKLVKVEIPINAEKRITETAAAFRRRVGTHSVLLEA